MEHLLSVADAGLIFFSGLVKVTFPSHLQTLMALFPKSNVLKGRVSRSVRFVSAGDTIEVDSLILGYFGTGQS